MTNRELKVAIGSGPICPHCREWRFDDWHLERGLKPGMGAVRIQGAIKCHGCGKFFRLEQYHDGECHCTAQARLKAREKGIPLP